MSCKIAVFRDGEIVFACRDMIGATLPKGWEPGTDDDINRAEIQEAAARLHRVCSKILCAAYGGGDFPAYRLRDLAEQCETILSMYETPATSEAHTKPEE